MLGTRSQNGYPGLKRKLNHEGRDGESIESLLTRRLTLSLRNALEEADVVLLHVGSVDFLSSIEKKNNVTRNAVYRYEELIRDVICPNAPHANIIATNLLAHTNSAVDWRQRNQFNALVKDRIGLLLDTTGCKVSFLNLRNAMSAYRVDEWGERGTVPSRKSPHPMATTATQPS